MKSRTTPVGILVLAVAGLFAIGCNAQTSALFEALVDPERAPAFSSEADTTANAAQSGAGSTWWPHPDGYEMELPPGWFGAYVDRSQADQLMNAVSSSYPDLAERMRFVLVETGSRVSAVAADPSSGQVGPVMLVLAQSTEGKRAHEVKQHVKKQIAQLPGVTATPIVQDAGLDIMRGWRFDYSVADPDLGTLRVRSYLLRFGYEAFLVNFVAPEAMADDADALFDAIAQSLSFGV
jgi:hypothetical protein